MERWMDGCMYVCMYVCRAFCDGTRRYLVPGNENEECIFYSVSILISYNKSWRAGTFRDLFERNSKDGPGTYFCFSPKLTQPFLLLSTSPIAHCCPFAYSHCYCYSCPQFRRFHP